MACDAGRGREGQVHDSWQRGGPALNRVTAGKKRLSGLSMLRVAIPNLVMFLNLNRRCRPLPAPPGTPGRHSAPRRGDIAADPAGCI